MIAAVFLLLVLASPAAADPCALIDPGCVTETLDETVNTVKETVGSGEETVEETVEQGSATVGDAATGVIGTVKDTVDGLLGKDQGPKPGGGDGEDRPRARDHRGDGRDSHRRTRGPVVGRLEPRDPSIVTTFGAESSVLDWPTLNPPGGGAFRGALDAAGKLAFPILLASMVLGFLVIQNHLDRKDPRLASAPLGPDLLAFE
jgi:hypothetical protein